MDQERPVGQQCRDLLWDSFEVTGQPASQGVKALVPPSGRRWLLTRQNDGARSGCISRLQTD